MSTARALAAWSVMWRLAQAEYRDECNLMSGPTFEDMKKRVGKQPELCSWVTTVHCPQFHLNYHQCEHVCESKYISGEESMGEWFWSRCRFNSGRCEVGKGGIGVDSFDCAPRPPAPPPGACCAGSRPLPMAQSPCR